MLMFCDFRYFDQLIADTSTTIPYPKGIPFQRHRYGISVLNRANAAIAVQTVHETEENEKLKASQAIRETERLRLVELEETRLLEVKAQAERLAEQRKALKEAAAEWNVKEEEDDEEEKKERNKLKKKRAKGKKEEGDSEEDVKPKKKKVSLQFEILESRERITDDCNRPNQRSRMNRIVHNRLMKNLLIKKERNSSQGLYCLFSLLLYCSSAFSLSTLLLMTRLVERLWRIRMRSKF